MTTFSSDIQTISSTRRVLSFRESKQEFYSNDIYMLVGISNYTYIHLRSGKIIIATKTLKRFAEPLDTLGFVRLNKRIVIHKSFIKSFYPPYVVLKNGETIRVSRRRKLELYQ